VMPAGMLGLLAMPFGLDGIFWHAMKFGIDWMIAVTEWVAALPGAIGRMAAFGTGPLIASTAGIILLGMLRTPLRWAGAGVLLLSVVWALLVPQPDILISGDGHNVGVRGRDGRLHLMRTAKDAFLLKEWLAADADARLPTDSSLAESVSCDDEGCVAEITGGGLVTLALKPEALGDDCERAALVVTARQAPPDCRSPVIDQDRVHRQGAMALRRTWDGFAVDAVKPRGFDRPWSPAVAGDGDIEPSLVRPVSRGQVDATPAEADVQADE
jgi:competence protein ComEC